MKSEDIKKFTTSAILCGLSVVFMMTSLIPSFLFLSIFLAILTLNYLLLVYEDKYWVISYIASSLLVFILIPDLEASLTYICMAWYPIVRKKLGKIKKKGIRRVLKLLVFFVASLIIYNIAIMVFGIDAIVVGDKSIFWFIYACMFVVMFFFLDALLYLWQKRGIYDRLERLRKKIK